MIQIPYEPVKFEFDGTPVYTRDQIDLFGEPEVYGVWTYLVVSSHDNEYPPRTEWVDEQRMCEDFKFVHRYCRVSRFKSVLYQLLGFRGKYDFEILDLFADLDEDPSKVWASARKILKANGAAKHYNLIPCILVDLKYPLRIKPAPKTIWKIESHFLKLSMKFNDIKPTLPGRTYFPNLRYVALRLLKQYGCVFEYEVPELLTARVKKRLDILYELIY